LKQRDGGFTRVVFENIRRRAAAAAASSPWPTPSITATKTRWSNRLTKCKSPETLWPDIGRVATLNPAMFVQSGELLPIYFQPFSHGYLCSVANFGFDLKFRPSAILRPAADAESLAVE